MDRNRLYIGQRFFLKRYLRGKDRLGHLRVTPSNEIKTLRFWSHLLRMEAMQTCSSIIFTRHRERVRRIEAMHPKEKVLLHLDPDRPDSLSLDPLFHSDETTAQWLVDFFFGSEDLGESALSASMLLKGFLQLAVNDPGKRTSLPDLYRLAGLGAGTLKARLRFQGRPGHLALLKQLNSLSENDRIAALREIHHRLSLFRKPRFAKLFSSPTVYAPIYAHEPSVLIVSVPEKYPESDRIMGLALLSIVHQILGFANPRPTVPLYLHLDGLDPLPSSLMRALKARLIGVTYLSRQDEGDEACETHIRIAEGLSRLTRRGKEGLRFHPALDGPFCSLNGPYLEGGENGPD
ncbi:MAG: hypothetical protein ACE5GK_11660 [Nitrospiria bacterium]